MPPAIAAAGISAAGSVAGGVAAGKGAGKAAKIAAQTADKQRAMYESMYHDAEARYQPEIGYENSALSLYNGLLGNGGDAKAASNALNTWLNSTDYQYQLNQANNSVNANAYASGLGRSGAALKALQDRASNITSGYLQTYLGDLQNGPIASGLSAKGALTGVSQTATTGSANAVGTAGQTEANAAVAQGAAYAKMFQNLGNIASNAYQSSYSPSGGSSTSNAVSVAGTPSNILTSPTSSWLWGPQNAGWNPNG
jgi:hypothetical protein